MPVLIVSNPVDGTSQRVELDDQQLRALYGTRIGQVVEGAVAGMQGYKIKLTGGTDKDGIPMRPDVHGSAKARVILSGGVGYKPKDKGDKKRKVVRGNTVSTETTFLNFTIVEAPKGRKKAEKEPAEAEAPAEEKTE
ncbi:30S ribosomal protein S6e [Candidatus Bathyarchaeota archaeon]|jgi:small subunit ribosomal protein S6e|nr:30S ribosomal protein S6e [Candidatus Bathyarchaeota archaeon]MCK4439282.1 30S ribosomal protein S6e [Candidatus Bathyarchaeota archaeon]